MNTNQLSINIFLTEKFLGKPYRQYFAKVRRGEDVFDVCRFFSTEEEVWQNYPKATGIGIQEAQDLFTPTGFFLLWEKAQGEEWWNEFHQNFVSDKYPDLLQDLNGESQLLSKVINPLTFPTLLAEFLGWKENL